MMWAVRKDGEGARRVDSEADLLDSEFISETEPDLSQKIEARLGRIWRDNEILRVQWLRDRHRDEVEIGAKTSLTEEQFSELLNFIQELRKWPESKDFPLLDKCPSAPHWIAT